jgi:SAM-dependent methyltransferase
LHKPGALDLDQDRPDACVRFALRTISVIGELGEAVLAHAMTLHRASDRSPALSEYQRWEQRFGTPEYAFGKEPNYFLKSCKPLLPKSGKALAVADGEGRNGVWLAEQGLAVLSIDFSPSAQRKAKALARERGVDVAFELADVHAWAYPEAAFDVVAEIFTQFSTPPERARKWAGMRKALKPGGLLIVQGYTPKQLQYGTGGPKELENLYTRAVLEDAFGDFRDVTIVEEEREIHEGTSHGGLSAVINLTARKPE